MDFAKGYGPEFLPETYFEELVPDVGLENLLSAIENVEQVFGGTSYSPRVACSTQLHEGLPNEACRRCGLPITAHRP